MTELDPSDPDPFDPSASDPTDSGRLTGDELVVAEIFGPTFQGEGPSIGERAGFVRLGRCNLTCAWCDTPYTWDWDRFDPVVELRSVPVPAILEQVEAMKVGRLVVTGGEPLLQQRRLAGLLSECRRRGLVVEIETNGTVTPTSELLKSVDRLNVSPKLANSGVPIDRRIAPEALAALRACGKAIFKFVVERPGDLDEVQALVDRFDLAPVWIMPEATTAATLARGLRDLAGPVLERGWNLTGRLHVEVWDGDRGR